MTPTDAAAPPSRPLTTVGALVLDVRGRGLFVRTRKWRGSWGVPGGKVDPGESLLAAVLREFREETGLALSDVRWAPTLEAIDHPQFHRPGHFVLLNFTARGDGEVRLNDEADAFAWLPLRRALRELDLNRPTRELVLHVAEHGHAGPPLREGAGR
jgi:ADP-ribose pyrophosphatase YjhB (NUDIX family)